jgi:hypothetical protein
MRQENKYKKSPENKTQGLRVQNRLKNLFKVSVVDGVSFLYGCGGQYKVKNQRKLIGINRQLSLPYFFSFIFYNYNTDYKKYNSQDQEPDTQKPGHIFKEIAGKSNGDDCFAQISKVFGNELKSFFGKNEFHKISFRLDPSAKAVWGQLRYMGRFMDYLKEC